MLQGGVPAPKENTVSTLLLVVAAILLFNAAYVGWLTWSTRHVPIDRAGQVRRARQHRTWR
jgi:1-acyl-sn-glycerol-3-phosphate acyltransferase